MTKPDDLSSRIEKLCEEYYANWESYDLLPSVIMEEVNQALQAQREEIVREERSRLDRIRQMMWELMPKESDYGGQTLTNSHLEQVKGFNECISIIDYEIKALTEPERNKHYE